MNGTLDKPSLACHLRRSTPLHFRPKRGRQNTPMVLPPDPVFPTLFVDVLLPRSHTHIQPYNSRNPRLQHRPAPYPLAATQPWHSLLRPPASARSGRPLLRRPLLNRPSAIRFLLFDSERRLRVPSGSAVRNSPHVHRPR